MATQQYRVVIIGGGFGGLSAAQAFRRAHNVAVTLIDKRNFHLFQPLLYQVATGALSPANIAAPLRSIVRHQKNTQVLMGDVTDIDPVAKQIMLSDGGSVPYDSLIVATGARHFYFGNDHWEKVAPGLKTIEDATELRRRLLFAFEAAERDPDPERVRHWLTFVVVGGGPTGVEMAGAVAEIARHTLRHDFRSIDPTSARVILMEGGERLLPALHPALSQNAAERLRAMGVEIMVRTSVTDVTADEVTYRQNDETFRITTRNTMWSAGVQASALGKRLAERTGAATDRSGRVMVQPDLSIAGYPDVYVVGDLANFTHQTGKPLPGVAQVAMQGGKFVAKHILRKLRGEPTNTAAFKYLDLGSMATIGRASAVAEIGGVRLTGLLGWLSWLFIHLLYIVAFENRVLILLQWAWNYVTRNRAARLITGRTPLTRTWQADTISVEAEAEHVLGAGR
jgi:NADH:ubiquinone reductase (H+-translocating)